MFKNKLKILVTISILINSFCSVSVNAANPEYKKYELCECNPGGQYLNWAHRLAMFQDEILEAYRIYDGKRVLVLSNDDKFLLTFQKLKPDYCFINSDSLKSVNFSTFDCIIDTVYHPQYFQIIYGNAKVIPFMDTYKLILYSRTLDFLQQNNIQYYFFEVPMKNKIQNLDEFELDLLSDKYTDFYRSLVCDKVKFKEVLDLLYSDNPESRERMEKGRHDYAPLISNGRYKLPADEACKYYNSSNGIRLTTDTPDMARNKIHILGTCLVRSGYTIDRYTVSSFLQREYINNRISQPYKTLNYGGSHTDLMNDFERILDTTYRPGDIVININFTSCSILRALFEARGIKPIELSHLFSRPHNNGYTMLNMAAHLSHNGNRIVADFIYKIIEPDLKKAYHEDRDVKYTFENANNYVDIFIRENPDFQQYLD
ncbi:MAG: hypothetical protein LBM93_14120, partial [Oscillospiraceae bacterium]|nr:hypothetical protein [Oscillospiraceae bacterium]